VSIVDKMRTIMAPGADAFLARTQFMQAHAPTVPAEGPHEAPPAPNHDAVRAAVLEVLGSVGDNWLPTSEIVAHAAELLGVESDEVHQRVVGALVDLVDDGVVARHCLRMDEDEYKLLPPRPRQVVGYIVREEHRFGYYWCGSDGWLAGAQRKAIRYADRGSINRDFRGVRIKYRVVRLVRKAMSV
jgi:hypothetical protein